MIVVELNSVSDVLVEELADLYSAEQQLSEGLPKLAAAAHAYDLREALETHIQETQGHIERIQQSFTEMGIDSVPEQTCKAMRGLLQEANDVTKATGDSVAIDVAIIGAAQRIEHYEIAGYGTARALAKELNLESTTSLLDQTLTEESNANKALTKVAEGGFMGSGINKLAAARFDSDQSAEETK
jgi:ferritin-like metal-binding protein YciE